MKLSLFAVSLLSMSFIGDKTDTFNAAGPLTERTTEQQLLVRYFVSRGYKD
jgi:hypothetical protein